MKEENRKILFISIIVAAVIFAGAVAYRQSQNASTAGKNSATQGNKDAENYSQTEMEKFAQCINESGANLYGAYWCPHCQDQKKLFGDAQKNLPYVECATPDGKGQMPACQQAGIDSYPTWVFKDGLKKSGKLNFAQLSQITGCKLQN